MEASFLEIYNEEIRDLLATEKGLKYDIKKVDAKSNEIYVTNLKVGSAASGICKLIRFYNIFFSLLTDRGRYKRREHSPFAPARAEKSLSGSHQLQREVVEVALGLYAQDHGEQLDY